MSQFDFVVPGGSWIGTEGELLARLGDFLERKSRQVPGRIEALCQAMERKLRNLEIRAAVSGLLAQFRRRSVGETRGAEDTDWILLVESIREHGREGTIENYSAYLVSF